MFYGQLKIADEAAVAPDTSTCAPAPSGSAGGSSTPIGMQPEGRVRWPSGSNSAASSGWHYNGPPAHYLPVQQPRMIAPPPDPHLEAARQALIANAPLPR